MEDILSKLSKAVDELAVQIIMTEDDVSSLGHLLRGLEEIRRISKENSIESLEIFGDILSRVVEKVILREYEDYEEVQRFIEDGIELIQSKIKQSRLDWISEDETRWIEKGKLWLEETSEHAKKEEESSNVLSKRDGIPLDQDPEIYQDFISEAMEHLGTIELNIINLEQSPEDKECINLIFRLFHTIKGVSGFLNLQQINQFSHAMETLLDRARKGQLKITQEIVDFILDAVDLLKQMITDLKTQIDSGKFTPHSFDLQPYLSKIEHFEKEGPDSPEVKKTEYFPDSSSGENFPPLGEILSSKGIISEKDVQEALKKQKDGESHLKIGEILISENKVEPKEVVNALREQKKFTPQMEESAIKVDVKKLDYLVDMVGELVIALSLIQQNPIVAETKDQKLIQDFSQLKRIMNELQRISMSLRMVPIRQTFQKMYRLVRDQSIKSGKKIDLHLSGEETEIDRNMVDSLYEPLVHMIRNSIDHGIEPPERRKALGKEEVGNINLKAYQQGGNIIIEIGDDGQGLDCEKIIKKAKEKGLIKNEAELSESQIYSLIFEPGFSTKDQVTDVSGRGVGMDVVKKAIDRLKGKIEVFSEKQKGTRFIMRIPLTLAIMDGIVVQIGGDRFIIPTEYVKETLKPRREDVFTIHQKGEIIKVRDKLLPLLKPQQWIGVSSKKENPWEALVLIIENEGKQKGLMIDELLGKQEVVIKNMGEKLKDVRGIAGATIMGDGRVGLILDIQNIFRMTKNEFCRQRFPNGIEIN